MKVLITNDDGINSGGLHALADAISEIAEVIVVAPSVEQSAVGHGVTISRPLRVQEHCKDGKLFGYLVNGTPADCIKLAIKELLPKKPDLVISGINLGTNTGTHIIYSGTVSGAVEGTILGVPAFAVSLCTYENPDYTYAAEFSKKLALMIKEKGLPKGVLLNVNVPAVNEKDIKGVQITVQGKTEFVGGIDKRIDTRGRAYYWLSPEIEESSDDPQVDTVAIKNNKISITPIHYDMTCWSALETLKKWKIL